MNLPVWLSSRLATLWFLPEQTRRRLATRASYELTRAGDHQRAYELIDRVSEHLSESTRSELRAVGVENLLRAGQVPPDFEACVGALLREADNCSDEAQRNRLLGRAGSIAFHRLIHLDAPTSPLTQAPDKFLQPFRTSTSWRHLTAPRSAERPVQSALGTVRVAVVVDEDTRFAQPMIDEITHLDPTMSFHIVRLRQWAKDKNLALPLNPMDQIQQRANAQVLNQPWARALTEELADADIVWVEWCQRAAVLVSLLRLSARRVVVRLHSFEAFTVFPHLVDPTSIDALVMVSPTFQAFVQTLIPPLRDKAVYIPNAVNLTDMRRPKTTAAEHTLGVVGWAAPAKDVTWALETLTILLRSDNRWSIRLIGASPSESGTAGELAYANRAAAKINELGNKVTVVGQVDDVAAELVNVGVIMSSSTRESFHFGLAEGVASGALPVVRDWPNLVPFGGAHGTWPDEWIVETAEQAAQRILTCTAPEHPEIYLPDPQRAARQFISALRGTTFQ